MSSDRTSQETDDESYLAAPLGKGMQVVHVLLQY